MGQFDGAGKLSYCRAYGDAEPFLRIDEVFVSREPVRSRRLPSLFRRCGPGRSWGSWVSNPMRSRRNILLSPTSTRRANLTGVRTPARLGRSVWTLPTRSAPTASHRARWKTREPPPTAAASPVLLAQRARPGAGAAGAGAGAGCVTALGWAGAGATYSFSAYEPG